MDARAMASSAPMASGITRSHLAHRSRAGFWQSNINFQSFSSEHEKRGSELYRTRTVTCFMRGFRSAWRSQGKCNSAGSSSSTGDALVGTCSPQIAPTFPLSQIASPLLWIGVGVGLSAWFSVMATKLKRYAIHQAFKAVMGEEAEANGQFNTAAFAPGSPFPMDTTSPAAAAVSADASAIEVDAIPPPDTIRHQTESDHTCDEMGREK